MACTTPDDSDVEAVLTQVSATMHALVSQMSGGDQPVLGLTITVEVEVENAPDNALLDTGVHQCPLYHWSSLYMLWLNSAHKPRPLKNGELQ